MTNLPSMMVTVQGPSRSGKTYLESTIAMPLLQSVNKESGARQQCLFVCDTNRSADATAIRVQEMSNEMIKRKDESEVVVIRVFTEKVEDLIMKRSTDYYAPRRPHGTVQHSGDTEDLLSELAAYFKDHILECEYRATTTETGIPDRRVTEVSLAYRMLQRSGIIANGPWKNIDTTPFSTFVANLEKYVQGKLEGDEKLRFEANAVELRTATLESADVIVGTPYCVSQHSVYSAFKPVVMVIDEAARIMEPLLWLPLAWYSAPNNHNLLAFIQAGDPYQTRPLITSLSADHVFYDQLRMSMMARLDRSESALQRLVQQYRMHPDIATVVSESFYHGTLMINPCTHHDQDMVSYAMRRLNSTMFGIETNLLAIDIPKSKQSWTGNNTSASNPAHVIVTVAVVKLILRCVKVLPPEDITILVPYRAQARSYEKALQDEHLKDLEKGFDGVIIDTVDHFRDNSSKIVIFDLVVTDKIGFLGESDRLCAAISRAECALYMVGNFQEMKKAAKQAKGGQQICIAAIPGGQRFSLPEQMDPETGQFFPGLTLRKC